MTSKLRGHQSDCHNSCYIIWANGRCEPIHKSMDTAFRPYFKALRREGINYLFELSFPKALCLSTKEREVVTKERGAGDKHVWESPLWNFSLL